MLRTKHKKIQACTWVKKLEDVHSKTTMRRSTTPVMYSFLSEEGLGTGPEAKSEGGVGVVWPDMVSISKACVEVGGGRLVGELDIHWYISRDHEESTT